MDEATLDDGAALALTAGGGAALGAAEAVALVTTSGAGAGVVSSGQMVTRCESLAPIVID